MRPEKATQKVQRGTKRPSGKRYRNRLMQTEPIDPRATAGSRHAGCTAESRSTALGKVAAPKSSRVSEANRAMRSTVLRQKMRADTAQYTAANITSSPVANPA